MESHLESCNSCREELAEIRFSAAALAELPEVEAPRSFALTPEHVASLAVQPQAMRSLNVGLRLAGGALAAALAVVLVLDIGGVVGNGDEMDGGGAALQRDSAYDVANGAAEEQAAPIPQAADGADGAGGVGGAGSGVGGPEATAAAPPASPTAPETQDREAVSQPSVTPLPAPGEPTGKAAAELGLNGSEGEDTETFTSEDSTMDSGDGLSALTVAEIVLAGLLGASLIGIGAATYAGRRRA